MQTSNSQTDGGSSAAVKPPKKSKTKQAKKPGAATPAAQPADRAESSAETVFTDLPNPQRKPEPPFIWIDHPQQGERLLSSHYVIRMGIGGAQAAEIAIDGGVWKPCRLTSGYWWYDWSAIQPGRHTLVARMRTADGRWLRTPTRNCEYRP
jgi:hypothetical protein